MQLPCLGKENDPIEVAFDGQEQLYDIEMACYLTSFACCHSPRGFDALNNAL